MRRRPFHIADVLRSMSDAVITVDAAERVTSMNAAAEALIGIAEAEALGRKCGELVGSEICG
ncbi:MAG TPA: PAS domain-containing protein, partial [Anaerolineales bacterium]|nr:PAS domain-containing protein [Anaerolineales bacterium]